MKRITVRQKEVLQNLLAGSPAEAAEKAGCGPGISVEGGFLVLRWREEQSAEAMDSTSMSLKDVLATHILPRLEATKTVSIRYSRQVVQRYQEPDWRARLKTLELLFKALGLLPEDWKQ
jgi:hypothetical protein